VKGKVWNGLAIAVLLGSSFAFSTWRTDQLQGADNFITVGLIQPALTHSDWTEQRGANRLVRLTALSDSLVTAMNAPPVFMIWPERAVPAPFSKLRRRFVNTQLQAWSERLEVALLSGALVPDGEPGETDRFYNSAVLFRPHTTPQRYDQERFTPFQRSVLLTDYVPVPAAGVRPIFRKGATPDQLSFDDIKVGMLLDFELLLGHFARRPPSEGADFLVSLSQQEEWGRAPVALDHLRFARLRAMESRRSVVRVTASGHSAVVSPSGETLLQSSSKDASARLAAVPLNEGVTVYTQYGDVIGWAALIPACVLLFLLAVRALWEGFKYAGAALALWEKKHTEAV
jgi:apolipoprotein N-acyltransferase